MKTRQLLKIGIAFTFYLIQFAPLDAFAQDSAVLTNLAGAFEIRLPKGTSLDSIGPVDDYQVYKLVYQNSPIAFIYLGDNPRFPQKLERRGVTQTEIECSGFQCLTSWRGDVVIKREMIIELKDPKPVGAFLHAWTAHVSRSKLAIAEKALFSIRTKN